MPRKPRIEYAGAVYHVLNRGDQGDRIFQDDLDRRNFLQTLGNVCQRCGWIVHSYVLMPNHFHLLIETPQANLVAGAKWFLGAYTQAHNRRHGLRGHVFQGRYKGLVVEKGSGAHFETVSTYIHLNPARAGKLNRERPDLAAYSWSSYPAYIGKAERPVWLEVRRVLGNLGLKDDASGWAGYRAYLQERVKELRTRAGKKKYEGLWKPIRYGWCLGGEGFEEGLVAKLKDTVSGRRRESYSGEQMGRHDEAQAEKLIRVGMQVLKLEEADLDRLRKGADEKAALAWWVQGRTMVSQRWIAERLKMGVASNVGTYARRSGSSEDSRFMRLRRALAAGKY